MSLFLHEVAHIALSLTIGYLVWKKWRNSLAPFLGALLGGVLVDIDHLFDYFLTYGLSFDFKSFFLGDYFAINNAIIVPFHAWEWAVGLLLFYLWLKGKNNSRLLKAKKIILPFILALALGLYSHLIIDTITNQMLLPSYSIFYRIHSNFAVEKLVISE